MDNTDKTLPQEKFNRGISLLCWAYNEELLITDFLSRAARLMDSIASDYEIILVDDGSTDQTYPLALACQRDNPAIKIYQNEKNLNVGLSSRRAISYASKEYLFWQTIDWSYDISRLGEYLAFTKTRDIVQGVRRLGHFRGRSDNIGKGIVSIINYLFIRLLFNIPLSDFQNITIYPTRWIQSLSYESTSSFANPEGLIKSYWSGKSIQEVHIPFIPRSKGNGKGVNFRSVYRSIKDITFLWFKWILLGKRGPVTRGTIHSLR